MGPEELIKQAERIINNTTSDPIENYAETLEFLRVYSGEKSSFYKELTKMYPNDSGYYKEKTAKSYLRAFISNIKNGLMEDISIERKAQIDVVPDFLDQAKKLLDTKNMHPAAATVIIGVSLEEFLRNWVEDVTLTLGNRKPSIDSYGNVLREEDLIIKQDMKDITSWGGLKNHAAHGQWDEVDDKKRISLMLEGVNLFMRKYGEE